MSPAPPADARFEIKFVANEGERERLRHWLLSHATGFRNAYPPRRVHNVYFDTYDYACYWENLTGTSDRTKVRYRWYGASDAPEVGALEVKRKRNLFGWKEIFRVAESPYVEGASWGPICARLRGLLPAEARMWLDTHPQPVLVNRYEREYFVSGDGRVRATVDRDLCVFDQRMRRTPNLGRPVNVPRAVVLEVKFPRELRAHASRLLRGLPVRVSRHSKYVVAMNAMSQL